MMAKTPFPVMIFAAGFGRRMGALTKDKPKPLVPVKGRALIDYAVDIARESGAQTILLPARLCGFGSATQSAHFGGFRTAGLARK